ncbi:hypothetical protein [Curtobacterium aurantiacum]|uniref:hypothetical protein n=1 Tax=Curtobacterium aurantiacum TaxID=3236919 RepID=UPI0027DB1CC2|nr:hypothetical protein [Curtobacterium flaccumfaciens]
MLAAEVEQVLRPAVAAAACRREALAPDRGPVPFDAADLPGYAARLYDGDLADPALVRLLMWKRLEQDGAGYLYPGFEEHDEQHLRDIAAEQGAGRVRDDLEPADVWALLVASAATWAQGSITVVATAEDSPVEHDRRRHALVRYVEGALRPPG